MRKFILLVTLILITAPLYAQIPDPWQFHFGLGYPAPTGTTSDAAEGVFRLDFGAIKPLRPQLGLRMDAEWDRFDPTQKIVDAYQAQGGYANIWSGNIGLQYDLKPLGSPGVNTYFFGQLGTHYKQAYLTNPGVGWYCDPWWGICYPVGVDVVDSKKTDTAFGANAGFGLGWPMAHGSQFYVEMKYQWVNGDKANIDYVPIMIGWRW